VEGLGCHGQGGSTVSGVPAADLVLIESDIAFGGLVAFSDRPEPPSDAGQFG
jgi:hypothetical protein